MYTTKFRNFSPALVSTNNLFDEMLKKEFYGNRNVRRSSFPPANVKESTESFLIELAVPGMNKADFQIKQEKELLVISYQHSAEQSNETENYTRKEFSVNEFTRSFSIPETVNTDEIKAQYEHGILKITLPKKIEALTNRNRQIEIA